MQGRPGAYCQCVEGLIGAALGAIAAFLATRTLDRARARRDAYSAFLGPAEVLVWDLIRRVEAIHAGLRPTPELPDSTALNQTFGALILVGSNRMMGIVNEMSRLIDQMRALAATRTTAAGSRDEWNRTLAAYNAVRRRFIETARRESAMWGLPDDFFELR
jgi:hypothetical protein